MLFRNNILSKIFSLAIGLSLISCSNDHEEAIIINDVYSQKKIVERLNEKAISHRIEGNAIWYRVADREKVDSARNIALNSYVTYGFFDQTKKTKFIDLLNEHNITYETYKNENGEHIVLVDISDETKARESFHHIILK